MKLSAAVVLYNRLWSDSPSLAACLEYRARAGLTVFVCDNSDPEFAERNRTGVPGGAEYIPMDGNRGVAAAFNRAAAAAVERGPDDAGLVLLDQDTEVPPEYFTAMLRAVLDRPDGLVFAPRVNDAHGLLSPCRMGRIVASRLPQGADFERPGSKISFINSGLLVRTEVFKTLRFNDRLFLEYIDHDFFRRFRRVFPDATIVPVDTILRQDFSGSTRADRSGAVRRFAILCRDFRVFHADGLFDRAFAELYLVQRAFRLGLRYRSAAFFKALGAGTSVETGDRPPQREPER